MWLEAYYTRIAHYVSRSLCSWNLRCNTENQGLDCPRTSENKENGGTRQIKHRLYNSASVGRWGEPKPPTAQQFPWFTCHTGEGCTCFKRQVRRLSWTRIRCIVVACRREPRSPARWRALDEALEPHQPCSRPANAACTCFKNSDRFFCW